jgi:hypothetical protein
VRIIHHRCPCKAHCQLGREPLEVDPARPDTLDEAARERGLEVQIVHAHAPSTSLELIDMVFILIAQVSRLIE